MLLNKSLPSPPQLRLFITQTEIFLLLSLQIIKQTTNLNAFFSKLFLVTACLFSLSANAHFQMLYTPPPPPPPSGHVMTVDKPEAFYMIKKGKKTDLINTISEIEWESALDKGPAYQAEAKLRGLGDYVFIVKPAPYFEAVEDIYIQQITKTIVNVGNLPTDWNKDFGLSAEIVPLTKPYAIYEGGIFSAVVKSRGVPVPFAAVEVEFMNYLPNMQKNHFAKEPVMTPPSEIFVTQTIHADANGTFHFSLLKAGQWGFAALGIGEDKTYQDKTLSQDAVIWVQATKLP